MHLTAAHTLGSCCIHVGKFEGPGIVGSDILLLPNPDQRAAMPQSYLFPAQGSILQVGPSHSQQGSGNLSPGAAAGIVLSAVAACVLLLVAGLFVAWNIRARRHARAGVSLQNAAKHSNGYNCLSKGAGDSEHSDHGSSGPTDQNAAAAAAGVAGGSVGSGGSSSQRASSQLPLLTPEQLLLISDQASLSCQGAGIHGGSAFNIVPDWGCAAGNTNPNPANGGCGIEPVYEPVYGMFEALHGRTGSGSDQGLQQSNRGQRLTAAISDQVRSIHHSRITSSMQVKQQEAGSGSSRRGSSRQTNGAGSGTGSASLGAGSSSAGGDTAAAAAAVEAGSAAGDEADGDDDVSTDLVLHEVIGQGGFGVVYRWVHLLSLAALLSLFKAF